MTTEPVDEIALLRNSIARVIDSASRLGIEIDENEAKAWIAAMNETLKDPAYAKLKLVDTVYGNDNPEESTRQAASIQTLTSASLTLAV